MTEEIIIDGVNVAGCYDFKAPIFCNEYLDGECEGHHCYWEEIKRLKQENETIREHCKQVDETNKILYKEKCDLIQENEELNKRFERRGELMVMVVKKRERYRSALEEIRDYAENIANSNKMTNCGLIFEKINEVLNEGK